jgi:2-keto-4-pentenoate hydratase/2-oxohepta-3-ene-1,7-dioic acid hydratase in catechol pathway
MTRKPAPTLGRRDAREKQMRLGNLDGRPVMVTAAGSVDVGRASRGHFPADFAAIYERWDDFRAWVQNGDFAVGAQPCEESALGNPVPNPRQIFAIGLNYADHARESQLDVPTVPPVFTKFASSLTGPRGDVLLPPGHVDWEVELVAVIGRRGHRVPPKDGWDYVAGLSVGQDISERVLQLAGSPAQFSLGKSYPGFAPIGPVLVTPDELPDADDLELGCSVNGEQVQKGRTSAMVFSVPELVSRLSAVTPLLPGDVIFTGTPAGVGLGRSPQRFLAAGDELHSYVVGIGDMHHRFVA